MESLLLRILPKGEQKTQDGELVRRQDREKDVPRKGWVRPFV